MPYKKQIQTILRKYPVLFAYLFGSYAKGRAREQSDLDIAVFLDSKIEDKAKHALKSDIREDLSQSLKKYDQISLVVLNETSPLMEKEVIYGGKLIYSNEEQERLDEHIAQQDQAKEALESQEAELTPEEKRELTNAVKDVIQKELTRPEMIARTVDGIMADVAIEKKKAGGIWSTVKKKILHTEAGRFFIAFMALSSLAASALKLSPDMPLPEPSLQQSRERRALDQVRAGIRNRDQYNQMKLVLGGMDGYYINTGTTLRDVRRRADVIRRAMAKYEREHPEESFPE